jgi:hypothetical protein
LPTGQAFKEKPVAIAHGRTVKAIRIELLIATLALLASAAASIATVVQTSTVASQLSASVWPYLTVRETVGQNDIEVALENEGLGPAIIQSAGLALDGKPLPNWHTAIRMLVAKDRSPKPHLAIEVTTVRSFFGKGDVVRPGATFELISLHTQIGRDFASAADAPKLALSVCYCSILQQCWIVEQLSREQPHSVRDCGSDLSTLTY